MTNLEKLINSWVEYGELSGHIYLVERKAVEQLLEIIKVQNDALKNASRVIDKVKYECSASVYTLEDDEMGQVFFARDYCDMALEKTEQIAGSDE